MKKLHFSGNKIPIFRPEPENQKSSFSGRSRSRKDFRHISSLNSVCKVEKIYSEKVF